MNADLETALGKLGGLQITYTGDGKFAEVGATTNPGDIAIDENGVISYKKTGEANAIEIGTVKINNAATALVDKNWTANTDIKMEFKLNADAYAFGKDEDP